MADGSLAGKLSSSPSSISHSRCPRLRPAQAYGGVEKFWKRETDVWKKKDLPNAKNASIVRIEKWDAILYDMKVPIGNNTHIRSEWVEFGTWIDVHISVTTQEPIDAARARAMSVLRSIRIVEVGYAAGTGSGTRTARPMAAQTIRASHS